MNKRLVLISIIALIFCSCSKNSTNNSSSYVGSYKGNINVYMNSTLFTTLNGHTILFTSTSTSKQVTITNNVMQSTSAIISGDSLTIPNAVLNSTSTFKTVEYGKGIFSGNTLTIEFHQDQVNPTTNAILNTGKWTGVLTKQ